MRIVRVKALGDLKLREEDPRWMQTVKGLIEATSDYFEREFGVRFVVKKITPWPLVAETTSTVVLLTRLKEKVPLKDRTGSYELIIGFTGENVSLYVSGRARVDRIGNCSLGLGNYMVSSVTSSFQYQGPDSESRKDVNLREGFSQGLDQSTDDLALGSGNAPNDVYHRDPIRCELLIHRLKKFSCGKVKRNRVAMVGIQHDYIEALGSAC